MNNVELKWKVYSRKFYQYYMGFGPVESLKEVCLRIKIVDILSTKETERNTIEAYVNDLARTPSNNTTRQLYSLVIKR